LTEPDPLATVQNAVDESLVARKTLLDSHATDRLLHVCMGVASETAVLADRLDRLERVLTARGQLQPGELDWTELSPEHADERLRWHEAFAQRILRVVVQDIEALRGRDAGDDPRTLNDCN
jgi:hypothetical protein